MISTSNQKLEISITSDCSSFEVQDTINTDNTVGISCAGIRVAAHSAFNYVLDASNSIKQSAGWPSIVNDVVDTVTTAQQKNRTVSLSVRITGSDEMRMLNRDFRRRDKATNVLSFPGIDTSDEDWTSVFDALHTEGAAEDPPPDQPGERSQDDREGPDLLLGDIVLCRDVISKEAHEQHKNAEAHWAHLTVHGVLHLMGFDHQSDTAASCMESVEVQLLSDLGFQNPYNHSTPID